MGLKFHPAGEIDELLNEINIPGGFNAGRSYRVVGELLAPYQFAGVRYYKLHQ
jgi:hypothetical protein